MEYLIIIIVTCITLGSQLLLKKAIGIFGPLAQSSRIDFIIAALTSPYVLIAIILQGVGFMLWNPGNIYTKDAVLKSDN